VRFRQWVPLFLSPSTYPFEAAAAPVLAPTKRILSDRGLSHQPGRFRGGLSRHGVEPVLRGWAMRAGRVVAPAAVVLGSIVFSPSMGHAQISTETIFRPFSDQNFQQGISRLVGNEMGHLGFLVSSSDGNAQQLLYYDGSALRTVAETGDPLPGDLERIRRFKDISVNGRGDVAFIAQTRSRRDGLFISQDGTLSELLVGGHDFEDDTFLDFAEVEFSDASLIAFTASLTGVSGYMSVFTYYEENIRMVMDARQSLVDPLVPPIASKLRFAPSGELYFVGNVFAGPVAMTAPAALYVLTQQGLRLIVGSPRLAADGREAILPEGPGRGVRDYAVDQTGRVAIIADAADDPGVELHRLLVVDSLWLSEYTAAQDANAILRQLGYSGGMLFVLGAYPLEDPWTYGLFGLDSSGETPLILENAEIRLGTEYGVVSKLVSFVTSGPHIYCLIEVGLGDRTEEVIVRLSDF
jgi:hypothetical protein